MSVEQKQEYISETAGYAEGVADGFAAAAFEASQEIGRMPHKIMYGMQMPMMDASSYFEALERDLVDEPRQNSLGEAIDRVRETLGFDTYEEMRRADQQDVLRRIPEETIERAHSDVTELAEDVTYDEMVDALTTLGIGIEEKGGEEIPEEERQVMEPVETVGSFLQASAELEQEYNPRE